MTSTTTTNPTTNPTAPDVSAATSPGLPSLETVIEQLCAVSGAQSIGADTPLLELSDVDSLDLMEWLYSFQESHPDVPADESLFEDVGDTTTMTDVYAELVSLSAASAS